MILLIRITGMVEVNSDIQEALFRLRLRRKYAAVLIKESEENMKLLSKVRNTIAYGTIDDKTLLELITKRARTVGNKKFDAKAVVAGLQEQAKKGKLDLVALGIKPFFRLHPAIGGIDTKIHFGRKKGVLGDNKEKINDLVRRML